MELTDEIIQTAIKAFNEKGLKFTMDDIANELHISKKTIYKQFTNKEELLHALIDEAFREIKILEKNIYEDPKLSTKEKIQKIIIALPVPYESFNSNRFLEIRQASPFLLEIMKEHLETGWELTIKLLEQGMEEGVIGPISIPVLRIMITASIESFISSSLLDENGITYSEALDDMMSILMKGIELNEK
ncbi:transcriptional regulator, TetR family [Lachnospiraceae bacterium KM106-2]|nr:transcriptional regulator, TetR family [Lachnospiraceae bacterium KM106-2]